MRLELNLPEIVQRRGSHSVWQCMSDEVKAGKRKLFPISLAPFEAVRDWEAFDADIGKDMAVEVREYFVPDFSKWKEHDAYVKAFERLVGDLKAGGGRVEG